ncbi:putative adenylate-forming enzyme [Aneurinibacillus soli]|uniref:AMP-binding enzyme n=1 Tax=Aneurinibacillus soli TaxID=1500254 RepID=A0A0U5AVF4_9BACL|nr:F390 synthetase-related protein [Aneurinibacillus soli]PYE63340.1 putative adenylate-forming enzyme [Aneurinibacillus soli]BAU27729.1 AMP-binding enzyme [Aneurinibacillus soli]
MNKWTVLAQYIRTTSRMRRFRTREALMDWQERQVQQLLAYVLPRSSFYREAFAGRRMEEWRLVPPVEKADMMAEFDRWNTVGVTREEAFSAAWEAEQSRDFTPVVRGITVGLSSGTSGNRGLFLVSSDERARWAGTVLAKLLPGPLWQRHAVAFFLRANSNLYTSVGGRLIRFEFFDLLDPLMAHIKRLEAYQPTILVAPPSMLRLLAEAYRAGTLVMPVPRKIISVAEVLEPLDDLYIQETFGQQVHQVYQCTEGLLAATCSHGTLHVNEDVLLLEKEYLDDKRFTPIITDFSRLSQPIIRYRLNDILVEKTERCPCGSVFMALERVEGRCDDVFYLPSIQCVDEMIPVFPDFIRRELIAASPLILEYRAVQHAPDCIRLSLKTEGPLEMIEPLVRRRFAALFASLGCCMPELVIGPYEWVGGDRKLRRVERKPFSHD